MGFVADAVDLAIGHVPHDAFDWGWDELERVSVNAMKSAFLPYDERVRLIKQALRPGYAAARAERVREP